MTESSKNSGGLIGIAYLPHGTMTLDPNRDDLPDGAKSLHLTCMNISKKIAELNPDLIILLTPHGLNLHQAINIYQSGVKNSKANGNGEWNKQWDDFTVDVELDGENSQDLYLHLKDELNRVERMVCFGGLSAPLRWGEVVPLYFALYELATKSKSKTSLVKHICVNSRPKVIIIAQPVRGTVEQPNFSLKFGRLIRSWCNKSSQRILLVISGDQAHTHPWSSQLPTIYQPDPSAFSIFPQSGTEYSKQFDDFISDWMTGKCTNSNNKLYQLDENLLINQAGNIEKLALSCGYTGSMTMQGVMENDFIENRLNNSTESINPSSDWLLTDYVSCCPTYYGMTAALYIRNFK